MPVSPDDPLAGKFTLEDATKGLTGSGSLYAEIQTDLGKLECELYEDKAPITVANFVGLARGLRPFKQNDGKWAKKNGYDGTTFHRVIKGFMIQGGDPRGTGAGEPGYVIPDEIWEGAHHNERGQLCMANRGKNTNGMQFFIMDGVAKHLDGGYTIFGKCAPEDVISAAALKCIGGDLQGRLRWRSDEERARGLRMGIRDADAIYGIEDLAKGNVMFAATGVTKGYLLDGVRFYGEMAKTSSIVMRSKTGTVRVIEATHHFSTKPRYSWGAGLGE